RHASAHLKTQNCESSQLHRFRWKNILIIYHPNKQSYTKMKLVLLISCLVLFSTSVSAQVDRKPLTFEHVFDGTFSASGVSAFNWMKDGLYYTALQRYAANGERELIKFGLLDGSTEILMRESELIRSDNGEPVRMTSYSFSADERKLLIMADRQ